jgi:hypothetical protein
MPGRSLASWLVGEGILSIPEETVGFAYRRRGLGRLCRRKTFSLWSEKTVMREFRKNDCSKVRAVLSSAVIHRQSKR